LNPPEVDKPARGGQARLRRTSPPEADKGLIPRPLGRLRWFPIDTPLLAAGKFILDFIIALRFKKHCEKGLLVHFMVEIYF